MSLHTLLLKNESNSVLKIDTLGLELSNSYSFDAFELFEDILSDQDILDELGGLFDSNSLSISIDGTTYLTCPKSKEYLELKSKSLSDIELGISSTISEGYRVYDYCSGRVLEKPVHTINFKTELDTSFHKVENYSYGRILDIKYYAFDENDDPDYNLPIVVESYDYWLDTKNMVSTGELSIGYWRKDGTLHRDIKTMPFTYSNIQAAEESEFRRTKIIALLKSKIQQHLIDEGDTPQQAYLKGSGLFSEYVDNIRKYIEIASDDILDDIRNDTQITWLDDVVTGVGSSYRDILVQDLDYWTAEAGDPNLYKGSLQI